MVRMKPSGKKIALAEISVWGRLGEPKSEYAFQDAPAKALDVVTKLSDMISLRLTNDEQSLLRDATDGKFDEWTFAEAALIASNASSAQRSEYLSQLAAHEQAIRRTFAPNEAPFQQARRLLDYFHNNLLTQGYHAGQSRITTLLDSKTYNCVSSATAYNILARRLNLDIRGVEVPDHVFSIVYDGLRHADIEVTSRRGFDPARNQRARDSIRNETGFQYIAVEHPEKRREVGALGMVALIYYNQGVHHIQDKDYGSALLRFFCALSIDPNFHSAIKNVLATMANWAHELTQQGEYQRALTVIQSGLDLAPQDATLQNHHQAIWHAWVTSRMDVGDNLAAVSLLRKAHAAMPHVGFDDRQSWVYLHPAEQHVEQGQWLRAQAVATTGMRHVDKAGQHQIEEWLRGSFLRWSRAVLDHDHYRRAIEILTQGQNRFPDDRRIAQNLGFAAQEWLKQKATPAKLEEIERTIAELRTSQIENETLNKVARAHAFRVAKQTIEQRQFALSDTLIRRLRPLLATDDQMKLKQFIWGESANHFVQQRDWENAVRVFERCSAEFPSNRAWRHNAIVSMAKWSKSLIDRQQWDAALGRLRARVFGLFRSDFHQPSRLPHANLFIGNGRSQKGQARGPVRCKIPGGDSRSRKRTHVHRTPLWNAGRGTRER